MSKEVNPVVETRAKALDAVRASSLPFQDDVIQLFIGGSELHGAKVQGTDDLDIYGVYIEPPHIILGLDVHEHFVTSTSGNERRNGPADVDITLYGLRKWTALACKGNPTALHFLFASPILDTEVWRNLKWCREDFLSRGAAKHFYGFADAQLKRMTGERGKGKHGQRPELEAQFGYDVKAGMHAVRLLHECIELMNSGFISLPRPEKDLLISIRTGEFGSIEKLLNLCNVLFADVHKAVEDSALPEHVNRQRVSHLIAEMYQEHWKVRRRGL